MASTTDNFNLPLYDTGDPANLRDQYNSAMEIVDNELKKSIDSATTAIDTANGAVGRLNALGITDNDEASASKTRWDGAATLAATNEDNIAAIDANLSALHANTVSGARKLWARTKGTYAVFVGDSITAGYGLSDATDAWPYPLSAAWGVTPKVYAKDGAGFVGRSLDGNLTLGDLANTAVSDDTFNHEDVGVVVLAGGINDGKDQATAARTAAVTALNSLHSSFPNAAIYFAVCPTCGLSRQTNKTVASGLPDISENVRQLQSVISSAPYVHVVPAWSFLWYRLDCTDDGLHPNVTGQNVLASMMNSSIDGGMPFSGGLTSGGDLWNWRNSGASMYTNVNQFPEESRYDTARGLSITFPAVARTKIAPSNDGSAVVFTMIGQLTYNIAKNEALKNLVYIPLARLPESLRATTVSFNDAAASVLMTPVVTKTFLEGTSTAFVTIYYLQYNYASGCIELVMSAPYGTAEFEQLTINIASGVMAIPVLR